MPSIEDTPAVSANPPYRTHRCGELRAANVGERVSVAGWVARRREHGEHLAFIDLRDHTGVVQCVIDHDVDVRSEWVVKITGVVRPRPEGTVNADNQQALVKRTGELLEQRLTKVTSTAPMFSAALRGYREAQAAGDKPTAEGILAWLAGQPNITVLYVNYNEMIAAPSPFLAQINRFLDQRLNSEQMLAAVDRTLYRNRAA